MAQLGSSLAGTSYRALEVLGSGAMGEVHLAEHVRLKKRVVVKILLPHVGGNASERFRLEAEALAKLRHDHIVEVLDCDVTPDGHPFLVMEYLEGEPLDVYLERAGGHLPRQQALEVMRQALGGLHAMHEAGFVHRDVKPANLFRCSDGKIKLLDFGIIKLTQAATNIAPLAAPTREGMVVGTPKYMAPEQATGKTVDRRTDVYAAGVVLYLLLTGRTPFQHHEQVTDMLKAHVLETPRPPSEVAPPGQSIAPGLDLAVLKALAKSPRERYPDALAFASSLQAFDATFHELALELGIDEGAEQAQVTSTVVMPAPLLEDEPPARALPAHTLPTPARAPVPDAIEPAPAAPLAAPAPPASTALAPAVLQHRPHPNEPPSALHDPLGRWLFVAAAIVSALVTFLALR